MYRNPLYTDYNKTIESFATPNNSAPTKLHSEPTMAAREPVLTRSPRCVWFMLRSCAQLRQPTCMCAREKAGQLMWLLCACPSILARNGTLSSPTVTREERSAKLGLIDRRVLRFTLSIFVATRHGGKNQCVATIPS